MTTSEPEPTAAPEVFGRPEVREAIALLREHGVTPDQYATVQLVERWTVAGIDGEFPDQNAAWAAAQKLAEENGSAEVWRNYGPDADWAAESWICQPQIVTHLKVDWPEVPAWSPAGKGRWRGWAPIKSAWRYVATDGRLLASLLVDEATDGEEQGEAEAWARLEDALARQREGGDR